MREAVDAEHGPHQLAAAAAEQPRDPHDLARSDLECRVVQGIVVQADHAQQRAPSRSIVRG